MTWRLELCENIRHRADQHIFASDSSAESIEVSFVVDDRRYDVGFNRAMRSRCPRFRICDHGEGPVGGDHTNRKFFVRPAAAEWSPGFQIDVHKLPFCQLLLDPIGGSFDLWRAGETSAVHVTHVAES